MPLIKLVTHINAPVTRCFDLARSIDLHMASTKATHEVAVAGVTSGLIGLGQEVTWQATHLGVRQHLTVRITEFEYPVYFRDEMVRGAFTSMNHLHEFEQAGETTVMKDEFEFEVPMGFAGRLFARLFLQRYMTRFLEARNAVIKEVAESEQWKLILPAAGATGN